MLSGTPATPPFRHYLIPAGCIRLDMKYHYPNDGRQPNRMRTWQLGRTVPEVLLSLPGFQLRCVLPPGAQNSLAVAFEPVMEQGRIDAPEVGMELQVIGIQICKTRMLPNHSSLHGWAGVTVRGTATDVHPPLSPVT